MLRFLPLATFMVVSALCCTTTTTWAFSPPRVASFGRNTPTKMLASTDSTTMTSSVSPFDAYQPGVSKEIVWKDDNDDATSSSNSGYTAKEQDVCVVSYAGTIMSTGLVFNRNEEFAFQIGGGKSMPGFDTGCIGMSEQTRRTIRVPPNRAYGVKGTMDGRVPPNADIEFQVTMKRLISNEQSPLLAQLALFGELRLIGLLGCVAVLALPPFFQ